MRIIFFAQHTTLQGAERCLVEQVQAFIKKGYTELAVVLPKRGPISVYFESMPEVKIFHVQQPWWIDNKLSFIQKARLIKYITLSVQQSVKIIKAFKADMVVSNTIAIAAPALAAKLAGKTHVWMIHEFGKEDHGFDFVFGEKLSMKLINLLSNKVIVNSTAVFNKYIKVIPREKTFILPYAVDFTTPEKNEEHIHLSSIFKLIISGRITAGKGQLIAVKALKILVEKYKIRNIALTIIGWDSAYGEAHIINTFINKNKLNSYIEKLPFAVNPYEVYKQHNVLLMCSKNEAFGRVTVEAMKLGLVVIGSNSGGTTDIIKDNFNGLLFKPGNEDSLAEKVYDLYSDRNKFNQMREVSKKVAFEQYNLSRYASRMEHILFESH